MGDPAGIGPEIIFKALSRKEIYDQCRPFVVGDAYTMERAAQILGTNIKVKAIERVEDAEFKPGTIEVLVVRDSD